MRKLILKCGLSPGDLIMLTAAVRDLHLQYPTLFATDVRTHCSDIWINNPYITSISDDEPEAALIECSYPLINVADARPYHCLHGFIEFFNDRFGLSIKPSAFKGDIHLSDQERKWYSQVREVTGRDIPFWIVAAGGKYDITIKWWQTARYQAVIDRFRGRIQFVQVGNCGDYHPKLEGVIDLRGKTTLRELIRLVYHAQGVLCSVTALMHLAAAVESKPDAPPVRPCVVIAGGREPAHWEAYPGHQFIHTNGALPCCAAAGCWKDRVKPLRDGMSQDRPSQRCVDVVADLPRCLDMIKPEEVVSRIETYFSGKTAVYLSPKQRKAARAGVQATSQNSFDRQPLSFGNAGLACAEYLTRIPAQPPFNEERGIVICAGGVRYFTNAWVCINRLRKSGCTLPIELWHRGKYEIDDVMQNLLLPLGVRCVDASRLRRKFPARRLNGWELKPYSILHSAFREVLLLDADNVPVRNPEYLFTSQQFKGKGAVFWPDFDAHNEKAFAIWRSCGMRPPNEREFETGQILVDKARCWKALSLTMWFNEQSDFYYHHIHGDKETFHLAFRKCRTQYHLIETPIHGIPGTMCQHDSQGRRVFQHRNLAKWDLFENESIRGFWLEEECKESIAKLRRLWSGRIEAFREDRKSPHMHTPFRRSRAARGGLWPQALNA